MCKQLLRALLLVLLGFSVGCRSSYRLDQNKAAGRQIVIAANAYTLDAVAQFPASVTNLVASGLLKSAPQCLCEDGKFRDFIYIPGFTIGDSIDYVILSTPTEMDSRWAIIFRIDTS